VPEFMNQPSQWFRSAILVAGVACAANLLAQNTNLQQVLAQMDASTTKFQSTQADISVDLYTAVVDEHRTQTGTTAFLRAGGATEMSTRILTDNGQAAETDLLYKNGELDMYQPAIKQETIISAGANRGEYDSMLTTGFGAGSKDLNAAWTISFQGMETIDGVQTAKLDLVPKDEKIRDNFSHFTIWVDPSRDISLKQAFFQPSGDSRTVTYSNIRYNKPLSEKTFTLHVASGTQVTHR
jgi:outer membrane lipoprotein-sorting protein